MDVFKLREDVVKEYRDYVESFIRIYDDRLDKFVTSASKKANSGLTLSSSLTPPLSWTRLLGELAHEGVILPETARFFGENLRLYKHQREALELARKKRVFLCYYGHRLPARA